MSVAVNKKWDWARVVYGCMQSAWRCRMKNRITTPDGVRIILTDATKYKKANGVPGGPQGFYYLEVLNGTTLTNVIFNTTEERDAFLARLDAYFQEIA